MVHIRAVPEGGAAGEVVKSNLPYTFYDRYSHSDRRQPLPSAFAARWIQQPEAGAETSFLTWREGLTGAGAACGEYVKNNEIEFAGETIRFDEHENATARANYSCYFYCPWTTLKGPATQALSTRNSDLPPMSTSGDHGGWMYMNLNNAGSPLYSTTRPGFGGWIWRGVRASQNWVVIRMANSRYATMFDAAPLGNGCSPATSQGATIGPRGGVPVCPSRSLPCASDPRYTGTNDTP
jgi:hypothetical protein